MNDDFETFKKEIPWCFRRSEKIEFLPLEKHTGLSESFRQTFPILTDLIQEARILDLIISNQRHMLFSWTNKKNGLSCGWLNKVEQNPQRTLNLIDEHKLLISEIGGILETYKGPELSLSNNQNFMFIEAECTNGIGGWDEFYKMRCEEESKTQIHSKDFICFVEEANGNLTLYHPETKDVLVFAPDHSFDNVEFLEDQPEYTFHKINNITSFVDYVEALAAEWKSEIKTTVG